MRRDYALATIFSIVEKAIADKEKKSGNGYKIDDVSLKAIETLCEDVEALGKELKFIATSAEVVGESANIMLSIDCPSISIMHSKHGFYYLLANAMDVSFVCKEAGTITINVLLPSVWQRGNAVEENTDSTQKMQNNA